jgi:hypothetical protein
MSHCLPLQQFDRTGHRSAVGLPNPVRWSTRLVARRPRFQIWWCARLPQRACSRYLALPGAQGTLARSQSQTVTIPRRPLARLAGSARWLRPAAGGTGLPLPSMCRCDQRRRAKQLNAQSAHAQAPRRMRLGALDNWGAWGWPWLRGVCGAAACAACRHVSHMLSQHPTASVRGLLVGPGLTLSPVCARLAVVNSELYLLSIPQHFVSRPSDADRRDQEIVEGCFCTTPPLFPFSSQQPPVAGRRLSGGQPLSLETCEERCARVLHVTSNLNYSYCNLLPLLVDERLWLPPASPRLGYETSGTAPID